MIGQLFLSFPLFCLSAFYLSLSNAAKNIHYKKQKKYQSKIILIIVSKTQSRQKPLHSAEFCIPVYFVEDKINYEKLHWSVNNSNKA
jgi:hypothetical protein